MIALDIAGPVQAEVLALCLGHAGIVLTGPCAPAPWYIEVGADDDPLGLAATMVRKHLARPLVVHSTSWRRANGSVLLTFVAPLGRATRTRAAPVRRVALARNSATGPPVSTTIDQVIEHALRHLSWLVADDPVVADRLRGRWADALRDYNPEPFRALPRLSSPLSECCRASDGEFRVTRELSPIARRVAWFAAVACRVAEHCPRYNTDNHPWRDKSPSNRRQSSVVDARDLPG